jgi:1-acyl-sn-glycerol-3-phosphate acyltransferase
MGGQPRGVSWWVSTSRSRIGPTCAYQGSWSELLPCYGNGPSVLLAPAFLSVPTAIPELARTVANAPETAVRLGKESRDSVSCWSRTSCDVSSGGGRWRVPGWREIWGAPLPELVGWHRRLIVRTVLTGLGGGVVAAYGLERLAGRNDPFIVVMNHSTRLEALLLPVIFAYHRGGRMVRFVADWNFALVPVIGTILRAGESILLVRKPAKPAILNVFKPLFQRQGPAFEQAAAALRSGRSVGIFPEGTTNRHPRKLLRGFDGAARLSLETGVPVIPVGMRFPGQAEDRPVRDRSPMEIHVGEALRPAGAGGRPGREEVRGWHEQIMRELARLSGKNWEPGSTRRKHHGFD